MADNITIPTLLTLSRLALAPWIGLAIIDHAWGLACFLFVIAAITDALDGALARWWQQESVLGACLDPIADKLLILTCYGSLMIADPFHAIPSWFVYTILFKDILLVIGALGGGMARSAFVIRPNLLGKVAMAMQIIFVFWILVCAFMHWFFPFVGNGLFMVVVGTSISAFMHYATTALRGWLLWVVRD